MSRTGPPSVNRGSDGGVKSGICGVLPAVVLMILEFGSASLEASTIALRQVACVAAAPRGLLFVLFACWINGLTIALGGAVVFSAVESGVALLR